MSTQTDPRFEIRVKNLRLRTLIGFNPDERVKRQDVIVNIRILHEAGRGVVEDRVEAALDYKGITKRVIALVEDGSYLLLERLVGNILEICCSDPRVITARVEVDKPHALRFADSVSVSAEFNAEHI